MTLVCAGDLAFVSNSLAELEEAVVRSGKNRQGTLHCYHLITPTMNKLYLFVPMRA